MLSVIVPTYDERGALPELLDRLNATFDLGGLTAEIIVVDDGSPDGTADLAEALADRYPVRVLRRPGKMGLASAVLDGLKLAQGELIAVMDADLSHPPEALLPMVRAIEEEGADLAVGSRYVANGGMEDWPWHRQLVSLVANKLTWGLTPVHDATSGFFVVRRSALEGVCLNPIGFKIGLEVIARARYQRCVEVPFVFTDRKHGFSKFTSREVIAFLKQLAILYGEKYGDRFGLVRSKA
ncbi:MAG TPA: polyprenol monophosphomannose synthase [Chloroflexota bacterium]|nr:polyprenol monophosphomannose synthase [Chloroflexota bacterium]